MYFRMFCPARTGSPDAGEVLVSETLEYYLYFPPDYDQNSDVKFPLLLFLHGGGDLGADLDLLRENGPPKLLAEGKESHF